jgi:hypothetical protein
LGDANPKSFHLKVNFRHAKNSSKSYIKCKADSPQEEKMVVVQTQFSQMLVTPEQRDLNFDWATLHVSSIDVSVLDVEIKSGECLACFEANVKR